MSKNLDAFNDKLKIHFKKSKSSIIEVGIVCDGELRMYSLGRKTDKKYFGLGSISKTVISTYICKMVEEGKIDLEKSIDNYLELSRKRNYPNVLSLLTHTSGYHAFVPLNRAFMVMVFNGFNKKNIYSSIDKEWLINSVNKKRPFKTKKYRYSDYNYAILAMIIETIEERSYKDVIIEYIRTEIGMEDTYYGSPETTQEDTYSWFWNYDNPFLASGGMFSTVKDMIAFLEYQINNKDKLALSHDKYWKVRHNKSIFTGFSWNSFYNGSFFWHIGGQGRYRSYALFDLKKNISIVILSTVDINNQHINRLGSSLYRNVKRNKNLILEYLENMT